MAITIIGPETVEQIRAVGAPLIEVKPKWSDPWSLGLEFELIRCTAGSGEEIGICELKRRYGNVKHVHQAPAGDGTLPVSPPVDYTDWWVRVTLLGGQGPQAIWTGRIVGEARTIYGSAVRPSGVQTWVAYEPLYLLRRRHIGHSIWKETGLQAQTLDWVPDMNRRDEYGSGAGNRSSETTGGTYAYGATDRWTRYQYAAYVLEHFMDELDASPVGPGWVLGGQAELLHDIADIVPIGNADSVEDVLRKLINPRIGLGFSVVPAEFSGTPGGFEVHVFALSHQSVEFGGLTLPRSPGQVQIRASQRPEMIQCQVVRSTEQRYGRVRVRGRRIVMAVTLWGSSTESPYAGSLTPLWSAADEAAYQAGAGANDAKEDDLARAADRFRAVYQMFGAADDWDHQGGTANPSLDELGVPTVQSNAAFQNQARKTLNYTPFIEGLDYGGGVPATLSPGQMMPPNAWVFDPDEEVNRHVAAESAGLAVQALPDEWGVLIGATPNHKLGLNHFTAETLTDPKFDHERMAVTIAFETDRRVELTVQKVGWVPSDGEIIVEDSTAECWMAAPSTVYGVNPGGRLLTTPGNRPLVIRNELTQLYLGMAGALARYFFPRGRAEIVLKGLLPYTGLLGSIVTVLDELGESHQIQGPVTSVEYQVAGEPQTILRAGFAG